MANGEKICGADIRGNENVSHEVEVDQKWEELIMV
jgi:hypothetical protein